MSKPIVYIASPYSKGDPGINTRFQMEVWDRLMDDGKVWPVAPLWSHFQHVFAPRHYRDWIEYDMALLERFDAVLRLAAEYEPASYHMNESVGADNEVAFMHDLGKPVFFSIDALYEWAMEVANAAD